MDEEDKDQDWKGSEVKARILILTSDVKQTKIKMQSLNLEGKFKWSPSSEANEREGEGVCWGVQGQLRKQYYPRYI